jgi:hypothetical protein
MSCYACPLTLIATVSECRQLYNNLPKNSGKQLYIHLHPEFLLLFCWISRNDRKTQSWCWLHLRDAINQRVTGNLIQAIASLQGQASFHFSLSLPVTQVHCKQCITDLSRKEVRSLGIKKSHKSVSWQDGQFPQTNEILWIFYNEGM